MTHGVSMPFCKGCGHSSILRKLNEALEILKLEPMDVCLVTDIGCIGLADALFDKVHTVHTTHGRSTAFATGIAIADKVLASKKLKTIVLIGDGGSMIGLLHIVNAALLNPDLTVIVCNNFLFGMTGGQQSSLTPVDFITQTSPFGNIIPPLDICNVAIASKADYAARKVSSDRDLTDTFTNAISHNGFAIVEVLELCTEHATTQNELKGNMLTQIAEKDGHQMGLIKDAKERTEFAEKYVESIKEQVGKKLSGKFIDIESTHNLDKQIGIVISGSAGERVQSSAAMLCEAALRCGLHVTQKNDNPVTQGSGFSLSEVIISPNEIYYTGVDKPDIVIIVSEDGLKELRTQGVLGRATGKTKIFLEDTLELDTTAKVTKFPFRMHCTGNKAALGAIDYYVSRELPFHVNIFRKIIESRYGNYSEVFKKEFYKTTS